MALLAVAQWEWQAQDENQLDVAEGSTVELLNVEDAEWWQVRLPAEPTPAVGWVPASHLAVVEANEGVPLAPTAAFAALGAPGVATVTSDASGHDGFGGYVFLPGRQRQPVVVSIEWPHDVKLAL